MNWKKLKEKFPNSYKEIREFNNTTELEDGFMIHKFLNLKGYKTGNLFINKLREYENNVHIPQQTIK